MSPTKKGDVEYFSKNLDKQRREYHIEGYAYIHKAQGHKMGRPCVGGLLWPTLGPLLSVKIERLDKALYGNVVD